MCASFWRLSTQIKELGDTLFCVYVGLFRCLKVIITWYSSQVTV